MMAAPVEVVQVSPLADQGIMQRLSRLEQNVGGIEGDVAGLQAEMTAARPKIDKIDTLESKFQQLSLKLEPISKVAPSAKPVAAKKPAAKMATAKTTVIPKATPPVSLAGKAVKVNGLRIGEQPGGKTRIVLDTSGPAKLKYDVDNVEKILVVEVPATWAAATAKTLSNSPLVASYAAENDENGSRLIVQLKAPVTVLTSAQVDPDKTGGHRSYLDLQKK